MRTIVKVFVVGAVGIRRLTFVKWLNHPRIEYRVCNILSESDIVIFTGGSDIDPKIYGNKKLPVTYSSAPERDEQEVNFYNKAVEAGKFIIGICRGAQLSCALSGGYLIQDVDGHLSEHNVYIADTTNSKLSFCRCTSSHHQMMYPFNLPSTDYEVLASINNPNKKYAHDIPLEVFQYTKLSAMEPEVVYFKKTNTMAIQSHPEWVNSTSDKMLKTFNYKLNLLIKHKYLLHATNKKTVNRDSQFSVIRNY